MYLEERVEQLEALAVDQSKQAELIAKGVAKLTTDTQQGMDELKQGQTALHQEIIRLADLSDGTNERITQLDRKIDLRIDQVNERFDEVDNRFIQVDTRFDKVDANQAESRHEITDMRHEITGMRQEITGLKVGQELILQILREKLS